MIVVPLIENPNDLREPHLHGAASAGAAAAIPALRDIDSRAIITPGSAPRTDVGACGTARAHEPERETSNTPDDVSPDGPSRMAARPMASRAGAARTGSPRRQARPPRGSQQGSARATADLAHKDLTGPHKSSAAGSNRYINGRSAYGASTDDQAREPQIIGDLAHPKGGYQCSATCLIALLITNRDAELCISMRRQNSLTSADPVDGWPPGLRVDHPVRHGAGRPPPRQGRRPYRRRRCAPHRSPVSIMQRKTKRRPDACAAERRRAAPDMRPGKISASMFPLVRGIHSNPLRSRERRFESCRGH
jgi:hypothetical protein